MDDITKIIVTVLGILLGLGIVVKITSKKSKKVDASKTKTTQKDNIVGGDQAGRDIKK